MRITFIACTFYSKLYLVYIDQRVSCPSTEIKQLLQIISEIAGRINEKHLIAFLKGIMDALCSGVIKVGLIGATNSGKSTTLNAFLRGRFLPTSIKSTTAHVLCIKHNPCPYNKGLYDMAQDTDAVQLANERKEIYKTLEDFNKSQRLKPNMELTMGRLELRADVPFLSQMQNDISIELYDTPGQTDAENPQLRDDAIHTQSQMDGLILILSQDTVEGIGTQELLSRLREEFPSFVNLHSKQRVIVLVNKYDLFYEDEDEDEDEDEEEKKEEDDSIHYDATVQEKCQHISDITKVPIEQVTVYSAKLALSVRKWNAEKVTEKQFNAVKSEIVKIHRKRQKVEKLCKNNIPLHEKVIEIRKIVEDASHINKVEELIVQTCKHFRNLKATDDTLCLIEKLIERAHIINKDMSQDIEILTTIEKKLKDFKLSYSML